MGRLGIPTRRTIVNRNRDFDARRWRYPIYKTLTMQLLGDDQPAAIFESLSAGSAE
jgi:hypothetical protein